MKKLFAVMIVAAAMTACNDNTRTEEARSADTIGTQSMAAPDTAAMHTDTTTAPMADTTKAAK